jgi:hypothetical protein
MNPAKAVIDRLGGIEVVSGITGRHASRIYRWMYPKEHGGTGGSIPQREAGKILAHARAHNLSITADELLAEPRPAEAAQ